MRKVDTAERSGESYDWCDFALRSTWRSGSVRDLASLRRNRNEVLEDFSPSLSRPENLSVFWKFLHFRQMLETMKIIQNFFISVSYLFLLLYPGCHILPSLILYLSVTFLLLWVLQQQLSLVTSPKVEFQHYCEPSLGCLHTCQPKPTNIYFFVCFSCMYTNAFAGFMKHVIRYMYKHGTGRGLLVLWNLG